MWDLSSPTYQHNLLYPLLFYYPRTKLCLLSSTTTMHGKQLMSREILNITSPFAIRATLSFVPSKCLFLKRVSVRLTRIFRRIIHWHRWPNTERSIHKKVLSNLVLMIVYICFQRWVMPKNPLHHQKKFANRDKNKFATKGSTHQYFKRR